MTTTRKVSKRQMVGDIMIIGCQSEERQQYRYIRILIQYNHKIDLSKYTELFIQGRRHPLDSPNRIRVSLPVMFSIYK